MDASNPSSPSAGPARPAWNKGKLTGPKPPLRLGQFEPGCNWNAVRATWPCSISPYDVAPNEYAVDRAAFFFQPNVLASNGKTTRKPRRR
jgi:hypothetical protein